MKKIRLSTKEFNFLYKDNLLRSKFDFVNAKKVGVGYHISITDEEADELRDLCGEQLQIIGFDEKYGLTEEGKILEALIDKFFCG